MLKRCKDWRGSNLDVYKIVDASDVGAGYTRHIWKGETGATQIGTTMVEAITSMIQKNGVLSVSGIRQTNATKDLYLVDIPGIDEFGTYNGMKLLIDFDQTNQTNLVYLLLNNTEYKINNVVLNELQTNNKYLCEMKNNIINIVINKQATETTSGTIQIATTSQVATGTDNTTAITPAKLTQLFVNGVNVSANGYEKLPNGLIRQWGYISFSSVPTGVGNRSETTVYFPIKFPNACRGVYLTGNDVVGDDGLECVHSARSITVLGFVHRAVRVHGTSESLPGSASWEAIGY